MARPHKSAAPASASQSNQDEAPKKKRGGQPGNSNSKGHGKGRPPKPRPEPAPPPPPKLGRPRVIEPTDAVFNQLRLLGQLRCTEAEAAGHFKISLSTFKNFLSSFEKANEAWEEGHLSFNRQLRGKQIEQMQAGNVTMLIWLGKQFLGQKDKHEHSGDANAPIKHDVSIAQNPKEAADLYATLIRGTGA